MTPNESAVPLTLPWHTLRLHVYVLAYKYSTYLTSHNI